MSADASGRVLIKVKTLGLANPIEIAVSRNSRVIELKALLSSRLGIPPARQRLIYQGRVFEDHETLSFYNVLDQSVIHLVTMDPRGSHAASSSSTPTTASSASPPGPSPTGIGTGTATATATPTATATGQAPFGNVWYGAFPFGGGGAAAAAQGRGANPGQPGQTPDLGNLLRGAFQSLGQMFGGAQAQQPQAQPQAQAQAQAQPATQATQLTPTETTTTTRESVDRSRSGSSSGEAQSAVAAPSQHDDDILSGADDENEDFDLSEGEAEDSDSDSDSDDDDDEDYFPFSRLQYFSRRLQKALKRKKKSRAVSLIKRLAASVGMKPNMAGRGGGDDVPPVTVHVHVTKKEIDEEQLNIADYVRSLRTRHSDDDGSCDCGRSHAHSHGHGHGHGHAHHHRHGGDFVDDSDSRMEDEEVEGELAADLSEEIDLDQRAQEALDAIIRASESEADEPVVEAVRPQLQEALGARTTVETDQAGLQSVFRIDKQTEPVSG